MRIVLLLMILTVLFGSYFLTLLVGQADDPPGVVRAFWFVLLILATFVMFLPRDTKS